MPSYTYVIIGGGMTADAAVRGIRSVDQDNTIALFSKEGHPPYKRPPLSKALWKGDQPDSIWLNTEEHNVQLYLNRTITAILPEEHAVTDDQGETHTYLKLLVATGGQPRHLRNAADGIIYYRTFADYEQLWSLAEEKNKFAVIGGGFIGSEIAAALTMQNKEVTMMFPETGIGAVLFPEDLSNYVSNYYTEKGVHVLSGELVESVRQSEDGFIVETQSGQVIEADVVVAGLGLLPDVDLAVAAGIDVDNGILVDEYCQTNLPDIFAAGDVANFFNPTLETRIRVEHEDNTQEMGECAGKNMAGPMEPYTHLPFFYSDLFDLGYEAVGKVDSRLETVADWITEFKKGALYYLDGGRVRGVLLWNIFDQVDNATEIIAEQGPLTPENLTGRLPLKEKKVVEEE